MTTAKRTAAKPVRRSVTLPREIAKQVEAMSKQRRLSDNRVLVELIEQGIRAQKEKEKAFFVQVDYVRVVRHSTSVLTCQFRW